MPHSTADRPRRTHAAARRCTFALFGLAAAVVLQTPARADAPPRWKFKPGETIRYNLIQKTDTTMKLEDGRTGGSKVSQNSDVRWTVESVSPDGVAELIQTIDRVQVRMDSAPGQPPFVYDSASNEPPPQGAASPLAAVFKALAGLKCTLVMGPRGEIQDVRIADSVVQALEKSFPGGLGKLVSKDSLKNMVGQSSLVFPEDDLAKGKTWNEKARTPAPQLGTMVVDKTYTFQGPEADDPALVRLDLDIKTTLEPLADSPIQIEVKKQDGKGRFVFDTTRGRVVSSHIDMETTQSIKTQGQTLEQTVVNTMEMKLEPDSRPASEPSPN